MSLPLRSVPEGHPRAVAELFKPTAPETDLPDFEGQPVDMIRTRLAAVSGLETGEVEGVARIDETVRFYVEGRVTRVDHIVDKRTGKLCRLQTVEVVDALQLPWDFEDD